MVNPWFILSSISIGILLLVSACTSASSPGTVGKLKAQLPVEATITFE